ncbi:MAG: hypothetical protein AB7O26_13025 [Planctomycetaceae bacterium]
MPIKVISLFLLCSMTFAAPAYSEEPGVPKAIAPWLAPQNWIRDTDEPSLLLGPENAFDDTHIFAPCVVRSGQQFNLYYCGSRGTVAERVFHVGLATSDDGRKFNRKKNVPIFEFGDGKHSILTPTILRDTSGVAALDNGQWRMWFSSTDFADKSGLHTLHESTSSDGVRWSVPSPPQLEHVYAPTVVKDDAGYRLWYADVSKSPWLVRAATSSDGRRWNVHPDPVITIDQKWERERLFYPCVVQENGVFLMWYGSYWSEHPNKTAIGFAASVDGLRWHKHPQNPVLRPDPSRAWESHYTTSESVMRLSDGTWRMWYATRKAPPFVNKYFAIGTARWKP